MKQYKHQTKKYSLPLISILLLLTSCVTSVMFNVEHPPLVDLRNMNSITVIPFEWNAVREYENLSGYLSSALISGLSRGRIDFVDPYPLRDVHGLNYRNYADVYISGRIINIISDNRLETREEKNWRGDTVKRYSTFSTVSVVIEYAYIRCVDNKELGHFRKTGMGSYTFEYPEWQIDSPAFEQSGRRPGRRNNRYPGAFRQRGWNEGAAISAIQTFAGAMRREVDSWTTTEERRIRGRSGKDAQLSEAKKLVRQYYYDKALDVYQEKYEQTGSISSGYNTAVLLEAVDNFPHALKLLEDLDGRIAQSGKKSPSFITREIQKIKDFINGFTILEAYRKASASNENFTDNKPFLPVEFTNGLLRVEDYRMVYDTDSRGRILSQTMLDGNDKTVWTVKNTWSEDKITAVLRIEGEDVKLTEYEYDGMGNKIVQRDVHNGALERIVFIAGNKETEELYMNGVVVLRAYWENGIKINEERVRQR